MNKTFLTASALLASLAIAAPASAETFDPVQCRQIKNVDVPFDVTIKKDSLVFDDGDTRLQYSPTSMTINGKELQNPAIAGQMYENLSDFLKNAAEVASKSLVFGMSTQDVFEGKFPDESFWEQLDENDPETMEKVRNATEFLVTMTHMCQAIFALETAQENAAHAFPATFEAPVVITLER